MACILLLSLSVETGQAIPDQADVAMDYSPTSEVSPVQVTLYWENDGTFPKKNNGTDRHYTNGMAVSLCHQPEWAEQLAPLVPFHESFDPTGIGAGYLFNQLIFTPEDMERSDLITDDRPYAGYLFGGVYWQRANDLTMDHFQIDLGMVGPSSQADSIQTSIHDIFNQVDPKGWDNQLHDEFTFQFTLRKKWRLNIGRFNLFDCEIDNQIIPQCTLSVGTVYRQVQAGAVYRLGYNLPDDFGPGRLADVAAATGGPANGFSCYLFGRAAGRAVEHNLFLDGNTFRDSHRVGTKPLVGEVQAGLSIGYRQDNWHAALTYSQTYLTEEFDGQNGSDAYGAIVLSVTGWF